MDNFLFWWAICYLLYLWIYLFCWAIFVNYIYGSFYSDELFMFTLSMNLPILMSYPLLTLSMMDLSILMRYLCLLYLWIFLFWWAIYYLLYLWIFLFWWAIYYLLYPWIFLFWWAIYYWLYLWIFLFWWAIYYLLYLWFRRVWAAEMEAPQEMRSLSYIVSQALRYFRLQGISGF